MPTAINMIKLYFYLEFSIAIMVEKYTNIAINHRKY